jgi:hypothetical protein
MSRTNQWFTPGDGIAPAIITADIQRYLGPGAIVRPGRHQRQYGYWVTAYRQLIWEMIQDLKANSQRWEQEQPQGHYTTTEVPP